MSDARKRQLPRTSRTRSNCWPMWSRHGREFPAGISLFLHLDGFDVNLVDAKRVDDLEGDESSVVLVHDALHVFVQVECGHLLERRPAVLSFAADSCGDGIHGVSLTRQAVFRSGWSTAAAPAVVVAGASESAVASSCVTSCVSLAECAELVLIALLWPNGDHELAKRLAAESTYGPTGNVHGERVATNVDHPASTILSVSGGMEGYFPGLPVTGLPS